MAELPDETDTMALALRDLCGVSPGARVLDFGCGRGALVQALCARGFDAWGCDNAGYRSGDFKPAANILEIEPSPYRLPFGDNTFDAVISTSVFEHAQNKEEAFQEIRRVLAPGGSMLHLIPGKWYLPTEPHIFVPLVSWMWPNVPRWWFALWTRLGVRNTFQAGKDWRTVAELNAVYSERGLSYWGHGRYRAAVREIFGNCSFPNAWFIHNSRGGAAGLLRRMPVPATLTGWLLGQMRMGLLHARKPLAAQDAPHDLSTLSAVAASGKARATVPVGAAASSPDQTREKAAGLTT